MKNFLDYVIISVGKIHITVSHIVVIVATIVVTRLIIWGLSKFFARYSKRKHIEIGRQHSLFQIIKYIIYFLAFIFIVNSLHIDSAGLLVGSGALLVGVGIGLQQTFNDVFSGIILLLEGSVKVHDKLLVENLICQVNRIGLRTTKVTTIDSISIIIPNSYLVTNKVINWTHNKRPSRFHIDVGVAYSSDIDLVEKVLLDSLTSQAGVMSTPPPSVQLVNYGDSSVDFQLFFYSKEYFKIELIKSDIRKKVFKRLGKEGIEIPFPQRDLWLKNATEQ